MQTKFQPTAVQLSLPSRTNRRLLRKALCRRPDKWISLKTKVFAVAKVNLAKRLQAHYATADAEAAIAKGNATFGDLAAIYLEGVGFEWKYKGVDQGISREDAKVSFQLLTGVEKQGAEPDHRNQVPAMGLAFCHMFEPRLTCFPLPSKDPFRLYFPFRVVSP